MVKHWSCQKQYVCDILHEECELQNMVSSTPNCSDCEVYLTWKKKNIAKRNVKK